MADENEIKYRVDSLQAIFLISASLAVDIVQALLDLFVVGVIINRIISPLAWLFFLTWFYFLGIKFTKGGGKNLGTSLVSLAIEMIPYVDLLPGWTVATLLLIAASRREDKGKKPVQKKKGQKGSKDKKLEAKKPVGATAGAGQKPAVGSEVKPAGESPKQQEAGKELTASQTTGAKTAEQKTAEASPQAPQEQPKANNQDDKSKEKETAQKDGTKTEPGEERKGEKKPEELYDTRTNLYKKQSGQPDQPEELAEFEDLPMQKEEKGTPILNKDEGGQDKQEFSMGDIYREPIDITPKRPVAGKTKNTDEDDSMKMAA